LLLLGLLLGQDKPSAPPPGFTPAPGHWPQWRGPNRDNVSTETGLLKEWPEGGPKLLWKSTDIGEGFPPVSVAGGRIYGIGYRDKSEFVTAIDGDGFVFWTRAIGPQAGEFTGMRFLSQRSITVDNDRLYAFTAEGRLLCLQTADGKLLWEKHYARDFGGQAMSFFYADAPLVDGNLLICKPGGAKGTVLALDKVTGAVVWRTAELKDNAAHAPVIIAEIGGVRQYIVLTDKCVAGVDSKTGRVAWRAERPGQTALAPTPIHRDGIVFVTSGFGVGHNAFRISAAGGTFEAKPIYAGKEMENHRGGVVLVGDHVYGTNNALLNCMELKTGTVAWTDRCVGKGAVTAADGRLIVRGEYGPVALVDASPAGFVERGRFTPAERSVEPPLSQPVVAGGRLYLRDLNLLFCYDLRGPEYKEPPVVWASPPIAPRSKPASRPVQRAEPQVPEEKGPDAAFVATPQDVVEKMIEAAKITKDDVVYDLGSGDGRIVIAASRNHGCRSVGFEINPGLVWESRFKAKQQKLDGLVTIEEKDLFTADLEPASVIMLYLGAPNNARLLPKLGKLKPGSRIVSHAHLLGGSGPKPDREIKLVSAEDQVEHTIYVWTAPLKVSAEDRK